MILSESVEKNDFNNRKGIYGETMGKNGIFWIWKWDDTSEIFPYCLYKGNCLLYISDCIMPLQLWC